eukprot:scaffold21.g2091.t1
MLLEKVEAARIELLRAIAAIQRLQQNPEAANVLNAERLAAYGAYERLLSALGVEVPDDASEQVEALIARGPAAVQAVLLRVEEVTGLERKRRSCADPFPSAELPQSWLLRLWRVVCFFAATAIIDVVYAAGFPVYLGWLRVVCMALHQADVKAREVGRTSLRQLLPEAADLRERLQQHLPEGVAPSLRAALEACLDRCAATLEHDTERLEQLELQGLKWRDRPFRTLLRSAVMLAGRLKAFFS